MFVGGVIGFFFNFLGGYSKAYHDNRSRLKQHKLDVAQKVLEICDLDIGSTSLGTPSPMEKKSYLTTVRNLKIISNRLGTLLEARVKQINDGNWVILDYEIESGERIVDTLASWAHGVRMGWWKTTWEKILRTLKIWVHNVRMGKKFKFKQLFR